MIHIYDFESENRTHLPFNTAILRIVAGAYPERKIEFLAPASHIRTLTNEMGPLPGSVTLKMLPESGAKHRRGIFYSGTQLEIIEYLEAASLPDNTVVLGAHGSLINHLSVEKPLHRKSCFDLVFHATISALGYERSLKSQIFGHDLFSIFPRKFSSRVRFVLLEKAIEKNLRKHVRDETKTAVLEHPVDSDVAEGRSLPASGRIRIAFIGGATQAKGYPMFVRAASRKNINVSYHCIGQTPPDHNSSTDALFDTPPQKSPLPQRKYDSLVSSMDLICLPLDPTYYSWAASGTFADCVRFGVPVITIRNDVFSDLEARYGRFGYVFDAAAQIPDFIERLNRDTLATDRAAFIRSLAQIHLDRSVSTLTKTFRVNDGGPARG